MSINTRVRGVNYPIVPTITVNDEPIDLTGAVMKFSYSNADNTVLTIDGVVEGEIGEVTFTPTVDVDFQVAGTFDYDIQRVEGGFTYTHQIGQLLISDDITK